MMISAREKELLVTELNVLSKLRSPYMVIFYGVTWEPESCFVSQHMPHGSLLDHMKDPHVEWTWEVCFLEEI